MARKARAISPVVRPPSVRSVSATCASTDSAGWQQVKMSSSRSSGNLVASMVSSAACGTCSRRVLAARVRSRKTCSSVVTEGGYQYVSLGQISMAPPRRAVGGQRLAGLHSHGGGVLGKPERDAAGELGRLVHRRPLGVDPLLLVFRARCGERGAVVDQQHVPHGFLLVGGWSPRRQTGSREIDRPRRKN
jgi:hypothetical protein